MKLTESDRRLLAVLGSESQHVSAVAAELDRPRAALSDRLAELADNGLVRDCGEDRYCRTESGRRLIRTAGGQMDETIDTSPTVEEVIAGADLAPDAADAVRGAYAFLRYWGEATADELIDAIYPEWPAGFASPEEWWEVVGTVLAELPAIERQENRHAVVEPFRYGGTPEVATPESDGFLPAARRGHPHYGSVTHAIESLDLSAAERDAVRAAFGVLRREGEGSETAVGTPAFEAHPAGFETLEAWWAGLARDAFAELPGVHRVGDDRWRYELPPVN